MFKESENNSQLLLGFLSSCLISGPLYLIIGGQLEVRLRFCFAIQNIIYGCLTSRLAFPCYFHGTQGVHNGRFTQSRGGAHDGIRGILCWCWTIRREKHQRNSKIFSLRKKWFWDCASPCLIPAKLVYSRKPAVHLQQTPDMLIRLPLLLLVPKVISLLSFCRTTQAECIALLTTGQIGSNETWLVSSTWDRWSCTLAQLPWGTTMSFLKNLWHIQHPRSILLF